MKNTTKGQTIIELLVVMALLASLLPLFIGGLITGRQGKPQQANRVRASQKVLEVKNALRSIRESGWNTITEDGTFHPVAIDGQWELADGTITENGITTSVLISSVQRSSENTIVESGGFVDPSTKKAVITVSWDEPQASAMSAELYLTRYLDNATYLQTTEEDFNSGTLNSISVVNTDGGELILGAGGNGDWCRPQDFIISELNLPQEGRARSVTAREGKGFTGTDTFSTGSFVEIDITNDETPQLSIASTIPGYSTNDVFIDGDYAYVAVDDPFNIYNRDVIIVDLTTNAIVGYYDSSSWFGAEGVYVKDNVGYATAGSRLRTFDLSSKTGSRPELGTVTFETFPGSLFATGKKVVVVGNYAYVAINGWSSTELRLINISNPRSMTRGARADVNGENGQEVYVNETGTRAYLATNASGSLPEFFIINTDYTSAQKNSSSFSLALVSTYEAGGMSPRGVKIVPGNRALLVGTGGEEYQVLNITNESSPTRCGGLQVDSGIYGVTALLESDGDAYSYIVTGDANAEFKIIRGGPGGTYSSFGIYESSTFDIGYPTAFNRVIPTFITPPNTSASFQIAIANPLTGNCDGVSYVFTGPDGTSDTFYTESSLIAFQTSDQYANPGRCFRYRAILESTDSSSTPQIEEVTINYSP